MDIQLQGRKVAPGELIQLQLSQLLTAAVSLPRQSQLLMNTDFSQPQRGMLSHFKERPCSLAKILLS